MFQLHNALNKIKAYFLLFFFNYALLSFFLSNVVWNIFFWSNSILLSKPWHRLVSVQKAFEKHCTVFNFLKLRNKSVKLNNRYLRRKIFLHKCAYANNTNHILQRYVKNRSNIVVDTFLDPSDVSRYLTVKLSAWKSCRISFELQMPQSSPQSAFTCSKLTIEILEQDRKYFQS